MSAPINARCPRGAARAASRINQEGSQEPNRGELNGEPEPCVVFAQLINDAAVTVVEVKVLAQLRARGLAGIAAIAALLVGGQEIDGHDVPLRQVGWGTDDIAAKGRLGAIDGTVMHALPSRTALALSLTARA